MVEETKVCKHCKAEKPKSEYQKAGGGRWLQPYCKPCDKVRKDQHRKCNVENYRERALATYHRNKRLLTEEERQHSIKKGAEARKLKVNKMSDEERKRRKSISDRAYRLKNAEKVKNKKIEYKKSGRAAEVGKAWQARQMEDVEFVIKKRLRSRVHVALKREVKSESTMILLGCSLDFFKEYFQSLFTEGMSWDKYMSGEIVIDHIKPCKLFDLTNADQQKECFNYKNLQPLWKLDNLIKGIKYEKAA